MRPSRRYLWLCFAGLGLATLAVVVPVIPADWALIFIGLLIALLLIDWLISTGPRALAFSAQSESEVFVGEDVTLLISVAPVSENDRLPATALSGRIDLPEGLGGRSEFPLHRVGHTCEARVALRARRRGIWQVTNVWLSWGSRLGLIEFISVRAVDCRISVVPNIRSITSGQIDLEMRSSVYGMKDTSMRGEGSDFHQLNEYVQGMDPRAIDWKHSARHHKLVAKEMRAERNHQIIMAMDNGHLMRETVEGIPKIDHKINAALALAWAGVQGGDLVGLFAFDAQPRLYAPPQGGRLAFGRLRSQMAELEYKTVETNHTLALSSLHQRLSRRSLIIVFSDFVDPLSAELLVEHMAILNRHHVVIFVSLRDPLLQKLTMEAPGNMDDIARSVSAATMLDERRRVMDRMAAMGVYVIEANPGNVTPRLLSTYLDIKAREVI